MTPKGARLSLQGRVRRGDCGCDCAFALESFSCFVFNCDYDYDFQFHCCFRAFPSSLDALVLDKLELELKNIFGRDNIYLVASFNDWIPTELRTTYEIKSMRKQEDIEKFLKDPAKRTGKKAAENII